MTRSAKLQANRFRALRQRDGDNCWLCGGPVDFSLRPGESGRIGRMHPTIDHVIERRNGGTSALANLRIAHSQCNNGRDALFAHTAGPPAPGELPGYPHPQPERNQPRPEYVTFVETAHALGWRPANSR